MSYQVYLENTLSRKAFTWKKNTAVYTLDIIWTEGITEIFKEARRTTETYIWVKAAISIYAVLLWNTTVAFQKAILVRFFKDALVYHTG